VTPHEEQRHLRDGPLPGERPRGVGTVTVVARCRGDAERVLERAREVLGVVLTHAAASPPRPSLGVWRRLLPEWFVESCAPEQSREQAERGLRWWRDLPPEERARVSREQPWRLADWLYWLRPPERQWFWWHAVVESPDTLRVMVEIPSWPAPLGALEWLLRAAGAVGILHMRKTLGDLIRDNRLDEPRARRS
jgi:hypothetical protein